MWRRRKWRLSSPPAPPQLSYRFVSFRVLRDDIKGIFGYDTDGDMIIDSGIAYKLDKQIGAYTQIGGILALKTSSLDSKIKNSESKIARLEDQLNEKEANYRNQFSSMQGTLNSLESQQNSISNFTKQQQNNR